jgi:outer membrane protein OmpA-like peptidoglycan-associated protein
VDSSQQDSGFYSSFTDLMTSLAVIFILMFCATWNDAKQQGEGIRGKILIDLQKELEEFIKNGVIVQKDENDPLTLLILVPESLLQFEVDKDQIPARGKDFLNKFMPRLATATVQFKDDINSIIVEGHTDKTGSDKHNIPLSQRRSLSVVIQGLGALIDDSNEREFFLRLLSASGRGSKEPFKDENGIENQDKSRRVVFKMRIRSFEQIGNEIVEPLKDGTRF